MDKVKYIRYANGAVVVFPDHFSHVHLDHLKVDEGGGRWYRTSAVSAGFVQFYVNDAGQMDCKCYGRSITLKLESQPEDSALVRKHILEIS
jgi:hypothetical protein